MFLMQGCNGVPNVILTHEAAEGDVRGHSAKIEQI
jgi:hypothetical protein